MWKTIRSNWPVALILLGVLIATLRQIRGIRSPNRQPAVSADTNWKAPSLHTDQVLEGEERALVIYGEELIAHTARYLGPQGSVSASSNGMNCQNCHLDAGKRIWGNNYSAVHSTYPKYRDRSGGMESIYKRVSDCFERSLNGRAPDSNSREYQAIHAYIRWLGTEVPKGNKPGGSGIRRLPWLDRAADPARGKAVYVAQCQSCHGANGEGVRSLNGTEYEYPPLWGEHSYNTGAGLFRISLFAGYVKSNMPFKLATHEMPLLTDAESWDVAAFVNSQPRPQKDLSGDWPDISKKPVDHPFGPYTDGFTETQHKYGPYPPILKAREGLAGKK